MDCRVRSRRVSLRLIGASEDGTVFSAMKVIDVDAAVTDSGSLSFSSDLTKAMDCRVRSCSDSMGLTGNSALMVERMICWAKISRSVGTSSSCPDIIESDFDERARLSSEELIPPCESVSNLTSTKGFLEGFLDISSLFSPSLFENCSTTSNGFMGLLGSGLDRMGRTSPELLYSWSESFPVRFVDVSKS